MPVESVPVACCNLNAVNVPPLPPVIVSPSTNEPLWFFAFTICKVVSTETISAVTLLVPPVIVSPAVKPPVRLLYKMYVGYFIVGAGLAW